MVYTIERRTRYGKWQFFMQTEVAPHSWNAMREALLKVSPNGQPYHAARIKDSEGMIYFILTRGTTP